MNLCRYEDPFGGPCVLEKGHKMPHQDSCLCGEGILLTPPRYNKVCWIHTSLEEAESADRNLRKLSRNRDDIYSEPQSRWPN